jgi:hypothetical protein
MLFFVVTEQMLGKWCCFHLPSQYHPSIVLIESLLLLLLVPVDHIISFYHQIMPSSLCLGGMKQNSVDSVAFKKQKFISHSLGRWKVQIQVPANLFLVWSAFWLIVGVFLLHTWEKGLSWDFSVMSLITFMRSHSLT